MVMSQVCDLRMQMNEKKKIGDEYEIAYATMFTCHYIHILDDFNILFWYFLYPHTIPNFTYRYSVVCFF